MSRFNFHQTPLTGLYLIESKPMIDERGYFERLFCDEEFKEIGLNKKVVNVNHSFTKGTGTVRGMHFQYPPFDEAKIVVCLKGSVWDVAVDIRSGSPTFLKWHGQPLCGAKRELLYVPEGFAHGFQTLEDDCELMYFTTQHYTREHEGALRYNDPALAISWKLPVRHISERDATTPFLDAEFKGILL